MKWIAVLLSGAFLALSPCGVLAEEAEGVDTPWQGPHLQGVEAYQAGDFARAVEAFEWAQQVGAPPSNLYNLARCYEQLGRLADALRTYESYLESAEIPAERRLRAQELRDQLASRPGRVELRSIPDGASVTVSGSETPAGIAPTTLTLPPGEHSLNLTLEGHQPTLERVVVEPGGEQVVTVLMEGMPEPPATEPEPIVETTTETDGGGSSAGAWVLLGTGLALALTGGVLDIAAYVQAEDAQGFDDFGEYQDWYEFVGAAALAGDVLLGIGAATLVGGLIWLLVDRRSRRNGSGSARRRGVGAVAVSSNGVLLRASF